MSAYWKDLISTLLRDTTKYEEVIMDVYNIITDYHANGTDQVCSNSTLDHLARVVCQYDPEWSLECIPKTKRCFRCNDVFIEADTLIVRTRVERGCVKETSCESCMGRIQDMGMRIPDDEDSDLDSSDSESSATDYESEYLQRAELDDEIARGR